MSKRLVHKDIPSTIPDDKSIKLSSHEESQPAAETYFDELAVAMATSGPLAAKTRLHSTSTKTVRFWTLV